MEHLAEVLKGGAEKVAEAGAELAGGHSIDDKEPKFGLAVTGLARPDEIVYNAGALPGDKLVLTKRLGIGVLASALKKGLISEDEMLPAIEEAAMLNAAAAEAMTSVGVHACTDISGFGLAGHLGEMLDAGGCAAVLRLSEVPLHDGVLELIAQGVYAGGLRNNRDWTLPRLQMAGGAAVDAADPRILVLFDPQTSGGLLMAVAPERHAALLAALAARSVAAATIGEIVAAPVGSITLTVSTAPAAPAAGRPG
jgi:selenide,water dikinase